jgi:hypothetical protein
MEETLGAVMGEIELEALDSEGAIDTGAARALGRRWEEADGGMPVCRQCGGELKKLGARAKTVQTVCGPVPVRRRSSTSALATATETLSITGKTTPPPLE